jgi:hypothetical protein
LRSRVVIAPRRFRCKSHSRAPIDKQPRFGSAALWPRVLSIISLTSYHCAAAALFRSLM